MRRRLMIIGVGWVVSAVGGAVLTWETGTGSSNHAHLGLGAGVPPQRSTARTGCDLGTMPAAYALHGSGRAAGMPFAMVGRVVFHGNGKLSGANTEIWNGAVDDTTFEGTYSIGATCRGVVTFVEKHSNPTIPNRHRLAFVVASGGKRGFWTLTGNTYRELGDVENPLPLDTITVSGVAERM
jgi:hypothetical protein